MLPFTGYFRLLGPLILSFLLCTGGDLLVCAVDSLRQSSGPTRARLTEMKGRETITNPLVDHLYEDMLHFEKAISSAKWSITLI